MCIGRGGVSQGTRKANVRHLDAVDFVAGHINVPTKGIRNVSNGSEEVNVCTVLSVGMNVLARTRASGEKVVAIVERESRHAVRQDVRRKDERDGREGKRGSGVRLVCAIPVGRNATTRRKNCVTNGIRAAKGNAEVLQGCGASKEISKERGNGLIGGRARHMTNYTLPNISHITILDGHST